MNQLLSTISLLLLTLSLATPAFALPQFAIRSARACDTCHVEPTGWVDPEVSLRKCSLNCNTCHVSPSGGGMRNESGIYYGRHTLPLWQRLNDTELDLRGQKRPGPKWVPSSQPSSATSQPSAASSQPTGNASQPSAASSQPSSQPTGNASQPSAASSQPSVATSQPNGASSQPSAASSQPSGQQPVAEPNDALVPAPGTAARYAGIEPHPTVQYGGDLRLALYSPLGGGEDKKTAIFPMQTDFYLAVRPYNPSQYNQGRVTLLLSTGALGSRDEEFDGFADRFFVREWFAMYHDLPNQMYARVGRFLPAHGWKTDDHTGFIRQGQMVMGLPFDHERQVTGLELGINPNYAYGHISVFNMADHWDSPVDTDCGYGGAAAGGWRDLGWQLGGSLVYGQRSALSKGDCGSAGEVPEWAQLVASVQWALNFHFLTRFLPLIYMGEYHVNSTDVEGNSDTSHGLSAFHEIGWLVMQGLNATLRYDWADANVDFRYDTMHRINVGFEWYPVPFLEVVTRYRHNWFHTDDRFDTDADEFLLMLHGWY
jgi:hypothetical protein